MKTGFFLYIALRFNNESYFHHYNSNQVVRFNKRKCPGKVTNVFCGAYHTFVKTDIGSCYVFGLNNYGQCGTGSLEDYYCPQPFKWSKDRNIRQIAGTFQGVKRLLVCVG